MRRHLTDIPIDGARLTADIDDPAGGALVVFAGIVRNHHEGERVAGITYTAYALLAEHVLAGIESEVRAMDGICACRIVHRTGRLAVGETSVVVAVRAEHRAEAFAGTRYAIDELKRRVPVWKEEHLEDGRSRFARGTPLVHGGDGH